MSQITKEENRIKHRGKVDYSPQNLHELREWATEFSKSELCPKHLKGKPIDVLMTAQLGAELNLKPVQAIRTIFIVNGVASTYGDGSIALIRGSGLCEYIKESYEGNLEDESFIAYCEMKRKGEPATIKSFSYKQAKKANLIKKIGPWQDYPDQMIQRRAAGKAARAAFADVLWGLVSEEEAQDILDHEIERTKMERDITQPKKGNEGVKQMLGITEEKDSLQEPSEPIEYSNITIEDEEALATKEEVEKLGKLVVEKGLLTQQATWLAKANVGSMSELKQKTVRALIERYSEDNYNQ